MLFKKLLQNGQASLPLDKANLSLSRIIDSYSTKISELLDAGTGNISDTLDQVEGFDFEKFILGEFEYDGYPSVEMYLDEVGKTWFKWEESFRDKVDDLGHRLHYAIRLPKVFGDDLKGDFLEVARTPENLLVDVNGTQVQVAAVKVSNDAKCMNYVMDDAETIYSIPVEAVTKAIAYNTMMGEEIMLVQPLLISSDGLYYVTPRDADRLPNEYTTGISPSMIAEQWYGNLQQLDLHSIALRFVGSNPDEISDLYSGFKEEVTNKYSQLTERGIEAYHVLRRVLQSQSTTAATKFSTISRILSPGDKTAEEGLASFVRNDQYTGLSPFAAFASVYRINFGSVFSNLAAAIIGPIYGIYMGIKYLGKYIVQGVNWIINWIDETYITPKDFKDRGALKDDLVNVLSFRIPFKPIEGSSFNSDEFISQEILSPYGSIFLEKVGDQFFLSALLRPSIPIQRSNIFGPFSSMSRGMPIIMNASNQHIADDLFLGQSPSLDEISSFFEETKDYSFEPESDIDMYESLITSKLGMGLFIWSTGIDYIVHNMWRVPAKRSELQQYGFTTIDHVRTAIFSSFSEAFEGPLTNLNPNKNVFSWPDIISWSWIIPIELRNFMEYLMNFIPLFTITPPNLSGIDHKMWLTWGALRIEINFKNEALTDKLLSETERLKLPGALSHFGAVAVSKVDNDGKLIWASWDGDYSKIYERNRMTNVHLVNALTLVYLTDEFFTNNLAVTNDAMPEGTMWINSAMTAEALKWISSLDSMGYKVEREIDQSSTTNGTENIFFVVRVPLIRMPVPRYVITTDKDHADAVRNLILATIAVVAVVVVAVVGFKINRGLKNLVNTRTIELDRMKWNMLADPGSVNKTNLGMLRKKQKKLRLLQKFAGMSGAAVVAGSTFQIPDSFNPMDRNAFEDDTKTLLPVLEAIIGSE